MSMSSSESQAEVQTKTRLQFDFAPDALARLDEMKEMTHAATRAETVRNALRLYEWFINEAPLDSTIKVVDKDDDVISQLKARYLLR